VNILHVIESLDPAAGGPPVVAAYLATAQTNLRNKVGILAAKIAAAENLGVLTVDRIIPAPKMSRWQALFGRQAVDELTPLVRDYDVLHLHGVWDPLLYAAARTARALGKPYVVAPHGMLDPWSLAQSRWKKKLALAIGWRSMLDQASALHLLNADEQKLAARLGLKAPGVVIPNGVNLEEFDRLPPVVGKSPPVVDRGLNDRPYILFLSRLHYKKGLDFLADAFQIVAESERDVHLVVAGPDDGAKADFERRIAAAGLTDRVRIPGPIYGAEKLSLLFGASCFVLPSRQEGFSVAILEALACGTPVVISTECHFPEVAEVGAGEVVPLDAPAVAAALSRILSDGGMREKMGKVGRELVADRFTWPRIAERSVETYSKLIAGRAPP
jgi:glycosyltransferase involved in cell wall biosynthesis